MVHNKLNLSTFTAEELWLVEFRAMGKLPHSCTAAAAIFIRFFMFPLLHRRYPFSFRRFFPSCCGDFPYFLFNHVFIFPTTLTYYFSLSFLHSPLCPGCSSSSFFRLFRPRTSTLFSSCILFLFSPRLGGNIALRKPWMISLLTLRTNHSSHRPA